MNASVTCGLRTWRNQFGASYKIPPWVELTLVDVSWADEACPSFRLSSDSPVTLWIEHPNLLKRKQPGIDDRFSVTFAGILLYSGDDLSDALANLRVPVERV
jgi:hypothetical protein